MPKEDLSHLSPDVRARVEAAEAKAKAALQESLQHEDVDKAMLRKAAKQGAKTYVVQAGDSLGKIAKELLGDAARWPEIYELNKDRIKDPKLIQVGQELRIP
jgi:nucleoid-associated protein YgaU